MKLLNQELPDDCCVRSSDGVWRQLHEDALFSQDLRPSMRKRDRLHPVPSSQAVPAYHISGFPPHRKFA